MAAVVAAGLNSSYHNGDLQCLHRAAEQAKHRTLGVLALATGRADQFLIQAQIVAAHERADSSLAEAISPVEIESAVSEASEGSVEALSACPEQQRARIEARIKVQRDRMQSAQARMEAAQTRLAAKAEHLQMVQINLNRTLKGLPASFNPVMKSFNPMVKMVACPRVRVSVPQIAMPQLPAVRFDAGAAGPV